MIDTQLLVKYNTQALPNSFVAIACKIVNKQATHSAILIRLNNIDYLHHFGGNAPPEVTQDFTADAWYIYKTIDAISTDDESEVGAFLQYCKRICSNSNITYGFIADGSTYDDRGVFITRLGLPEFGTCVGFCANTLSNTLIDADACYFELNDWDDSGIDQRVDSWAIMQAAKKYPDLDWNLYNAFKKRITPLEFLASSFVNEYPILKEKIAPLLEPIQKQIDILF
jgi:hypothetical protein